MMFFDGYIGAPPTLTVFSDFDSAESGAAAPATSARAAAAAIKVKRLDMGSSIFAVESAVEVCRQAAGETRAVRLHVEIRPLNGRVSRPRPRLAHGCVNAFRAGCVRLSSAHELPGRLTSL